MLNTPLLSRSFAQDLLAVTQEQEQLPRTTQDVCFPVGAVLLWLPSPWAQFAARASAGEEGADASPLLPTATLVL